MGKITIDYGGQKLHLNKSQALVGIRPTRNRSRTINRLQRDIQDMDTGMNLARFNVLDVSNAVDDTEEMLNKLRTSNEVQVGTHIYHTSNDGVAFVPSGQIYLQFDAKATTSKCQKLIEKHHLQVVKSFGEKELVVRTSKASKNPIKVVVDLQTSKDVIIAEPDLSTPGKLWSSFIRPADNLLDRQWHLENTGTHRGTSIGLKRGADARICMLWM